MLHCRRATIAVAAVVALFAAPGCAQMSRTEPLRTGCGVDPDAKVSRIEIRYDAGGELIAVPDVCRVKPGTQIVWFSTGTADGAPKAVKDFRIEFREGSPDSEYKGTFDASLDGAHGYDAPLERTRATKKGGEAANTYKYWVIVGADELDPSIIIVDP